MNAFVSRHRFEILAIAIAMVCASLHLWQNRVPAIGNLDESSLQGLASTGPGLTIVRAIQALEGRATDAKFRIRGEAPVHPDLVVVEVDEKSAQRFGLWPWPRSLIARAIHNLHAAKVRAVGLDMYFPDATFEARRLAFEEALKELDRTAPPTQHPELASYRAALEKGANYSEDDALQAALAEAPEVVQGVTTYLEKDLEDQQRHLPDQRKALAPRLLTRFPGAAEGTFYEPPFAKVASWQQYSAQTSLPGIAEASARYGHFSVAPDADGTLRRTPLFARLHDPEGLLPNLELATAAAYYGAAIEPEWDPESESLAGARLRLKDGEVKHVPLSADEPFTLINHLGKGEHFERISLADVVEGKVPASKLAGKAVLMGVTLVGNYDQRVTPFAQIEPGIYTHASFLSNILSGDFLTRPRMMVVIELLFILVSALLLARLLPRVRFAYKLGIVAALTAGYLVVDDVLFAHGIQLATVMPAANLMVVSFGVIFLGYLSTDREKGVLRSAFQHYLNESVMEQMLQHPDKLKLGGEKKEMTVLFSDIRGFTTLSERMAPEALVKFINSYLTPMTRIVFQEGGTLDKYIGDALMAFWGAPIDQPDHALRACRASVQFLEKLKELKAAWRDQNLPEFDIGVGINTGPMIVGNMGSDIRFDYTVMGDSVNLASRLEGTNKEYETRILISEATFLQAKDHVIARRLGAVRVKGKRKPVRIYELRAMGQPQGVELDAIKTFDRALDLYTEGKFEEAEVAFHRVLELWPEDPPSRRYIEEIAVLKTRPLSPTWDGVYTATHK